MKITVCIGSSCHLKGSRNVVEIFRELVEKHNIANVELSGTFCLDNCLNGVCINVDGEHFSTKPEEAENFFLEHIVGRKSEL